jgi:hypothetical protein
VDDLVDHLSCATEILIEDGSIDFFEAFSLAKEKVMPDYALQIEDDLKLLTTKKYYTMIKKLAFIGGYASVVCLCLAILFFSQSLLGSKRSELKVQAIQSEYYSSNLEEDTPSEFSNRLSTLMSNSAIESSQKFDLAETFLIISFVVFAALYLPYQFYSKYQRSEQALQHA